MNSSGESRGVIVQRAPGDDEMASNKDMYDKLCC
jgi:hypothetical protein